MRLRFPLSLVFLASLGLADVEFTIPKPGDKLSGSSITVNWQDAGGTVPIAELAGFQLFLVAGGDTDASAQIVESVSGDHTAGATTATISIKAPADGPPGTNAYYLKMMSSPKSGAGQLINYSQRFTVNGMQGKWSSDAIESAYKSVSGDVTKVPATQNQIQSNQNNPGAAGAGGPEYSVSYQFQTTGLTKYAPMQVHAPTAITKQDMNPLFPTSVFAVAETALPIPSQLTTLTAPLTYSYSTRVNDAPAASPPSDMQKFLARWRD